MLKILLIGPTGKIGAAVLNELLRHTNKYSVGVLTRTRFTINQEYDLTVFKGDILHNTISQAIEWSDLVINCTGIVSYKKLDKALLHRVNVDGVKNIVQFCRRFHKPLIHSSSAIAYGSSKQPIWFTENDKSIEVYRGEYAKSKYLADQVIINSNIPAVILRPGTLVSTLRSLYSFYNKGFVAGLEGGASFALMEEVAKAYINAIELVVKSSEQHIINLGGNNLTFLEVFDFFKLINDKPTRFVNKTSMSFLSHINDRVLLPLFKKSILTRDNYITGNHFTFIDSTKAKEQLNYQIHPFEISLKKVIEYGDR
jgi:dihydroflavonol-4-reductase